MKIKFPQKLIAPCGMNCGLCMAYLRDKNKCQGCLGSDIGKSKSCISCRIKNCKVLKAGKMKFCFECDDFPCERLKHLDKRYRTKYHMSMVENLFNMRDEGIRKFVDSEGKRWRCASCGGIVCVHRGECSDCRAKIKSK